jgi:hypothetical protein
MSNRIALLVPALAAAIGLSLFAAACGGSSGKGVAQIGSTQATTTGSDSGSSPNEGRGSSLVAFSACMRKHGLPNFPDPQAVGGRYRLDTDSDNGTRTPSPQFTRAREACKELLPFGNMPNPNEQAKQLQHAVKYAACMRAHGMPDYPDPKLSPDGGITLGIAPDSPQFKTAQKACEHLLRGASTS